MNEDSPARNDTDAARIPPIPVLPADPATLLDERLGLTDIVDIADVDPERERRRA
jgi:hypothetical protein